jgi:hypothetical protein
MPSPEGGRLAGVRDGVSSVMFMTVRKQSEVGGRQGGGSMEEKIGRCLTCTPPGVGSPSSATWPAGQPRKLCQVPRPHRGPFSTNRPTPTRLFVHRTGMIGAYCMIPSALDMPISRPAGQAWRREHKGLPAGPTLHHLDRRGYACTSLHCCCPDPLLPALAILVPLKPPFCRNGSYAFVPGSLARGGSRAPFSPSYLDPL